MIALIASALLGLYVFLPDFLFNRLAYPFVRLRKPDKTRFEEILSGVGVSFLPFIITVFLSWKCWFIGHFPFPLDLSSAEKYNDYKNLFLAAYSESYFSTHAPSVWNSFEHVRSYQLRFLSWMYLLLGLQIAIVNVATVQFGTLSQYGWYRATFGKLLLARVSHWHALLTGFLFPRKNRTTVEIDVITSDNHLYSGTVADHFVDKDGELSGILLKNFRRFKFKHLEEDRKAGKNPAPKDYWKTIPGANFYIPADKILNINIRYETSAPVLVKEILQLVESMKLADAVSVSLEDARADATDHDSELFGEVNEAQSESMGDSLNTAAPEKVPPENNKAEP